MNVVECRSSWSEQVSYLCALRDPSITQYLTSINNMIGCAVGLGSRKITRLPLARGADAVDFSKDPSGRTSELAWRENHVCPQ